LKSTYRRECISRFTHLGKLLTLLPSSPPSERTKQSSNRAAPAQSRDVSASTRRKPTPTLGVAGSGDTMPNGKSVALL
jgi:hypothetical protein